MPQVTCMVPWVAEEVKTVMGFYCTVILLVRLECGALWCYIHATWTGVLLVVGVDCITQRRRKRLPDHEWRSLYVPPMIQLADKEKLVNFMILLFSFTSRYAWIRQYLGIDRRGESMFKLTKQFYIPTITMIDHNFKVINPEALLDIQIEPRDFPWAKRCLV